MTNTAHIDFDIIVNQAARYGADHGIAPDEVFEHIHLLIDEWLEPIADRVSTEEYKLYRSCPRDSNYRRLFLPTYKSNRDKAEPSEEDKRRADMIRLAWEYASLTFRIEALPFAEADDLLGSQLLPGDIMVTIDKDLRTLPGWHFNPRKDAGPVLVSEAEASYNLHYQWLVGDSVDNIPGCPRIGPVRAKRLLDLAVHEDRCLTQECEETYNCAGCPKWYTLSQWIAVRINPDVIRYEIPLPATYKRSSLMIPL